MACYLPRTIRPISPFNRCHFSSLSSSSSSSSATPKNPNSTKPTVKIPLFLRSPTHSATVSELHQWRDWAQNLAISVGSKFLDSDYGPEPKNLLRETDWFLQDAVENYTHFSELVALKSGTLIRLRAGLDEMYRLWEQRIEERRPFQYIVGCEHWRDMVLAVQEGVLIPRPETEQLVDMVGEAVFTENGFGEGLWADLGTGSGAIAIGIARILGSGGKVFATDLSPIAVSVAKFNVERHGLQDKVEVRQGSWFEPLEDIKGQLEGLVSNPPYIPSNQISGLQAEVGRHEPRTALDGGENGMDDLLQLCEESSLALKPGGFFAFETNWGEQAEFVADYLTTKLKNSFRDVKIESDFAGILRFVTGFRH